MTLANTLQTFRDSIVTVNGLIASAHATDATGIKLWSSNETIFITESAFLKMFISWESFLERSFILYLVGKLSISGKTITRYVNPIDEEHAHEILIGVMKYVDWKSPDNVRKFAKLYFDSGEHYETSIRSINSDLLDLKTIRNAAAHLSSTTTKQLDGLATRKFGRVITGISVYDLITSTNPSSPIGKTILQSYQEIFDTAAYLIANY